MPRINNQLLDNVSDITSARSGLAVAERSPGEVRRAQLAMASVAGGAEVVGDPVAENELIEALSALGIYTKLGRIQSCPAHRMVKTGTGTGPQAGLPRNYRFPGEREPSGRLSRRGRRRSRGRESEEL